MADWFRLSHARQEKPLLTLLSAKRAAVGGDRGWDRLATKETPESEPVFRAQLKADGPALLAPLSAEPPFRLGSQAGRAAALGSGPEPRGHRPSSWETHRHAGLPTPQELQIVPREEPQDASPPQSAPLGPP